jgi:Zn-dependent peptidase ImmA (M78 family)
VVSGSVGNLNPWQNFPASKTPERGFFDCARELGHLAFCKHGGPKPTQSAELEANQFSSAFLMPEHDVKAIIPRRVISAKSIIDLKQWWRVSALALVYRLKEIEFLTPWQFRSMCIDLGKMGYRTGEKIGIERETSIL